MYDHLFVTSIALAGCFLFFYRNPRKMSPVGLLADVIAKKIQDSWGKLQKDTEVDFTAHKDWLILGQKYYRNRLIALQKEEDNRLRDHLAFREKAVNERTEAKEPNRFLVFIGEIAGVVAKAILICMAIIAATAVIGSLFHLLLNFGDYVDEILVFVKDFALIFPILIIAYLLPNLFKTRLQEALALGTGVNWIGYESYSIQENEKNIETITIMLSETEGESSGVRPLSGDQDLTKAEQTPLPAPPGISELAFSINKDALNSIKKDLLISRRFHTAVSVVSFVLFVISILGTLYMSLFTDTNTFKSLFGGIGLGAVLGGFTYLSLVNVRASHISLALFESYLAEVKTTLTEAETYQQQGKRVEMRKEAWITFRNGLNALWVEERSREKEFLTSLKKNKDK